MNKKIRCDFTLGDLSLPTLPLNRAQSCLQKLCTCSALPQAAQPESDPCPEPHRLLFAAPQRPPLMTFSPEVKNLITRYKNQQGPTDVY